MDYKQKYKLLLENVAKAPYGTFPTYFVKVKPAFLEDSSKYRMIEGDYMLNIELTEKAEEDDYLDYIEFLYQFTGLSDEVLFIDYDYEEEE